jgi:hypothetical protein
LGGESESTNLRTPVSSATPGPIEEFITQTVLPEDVVESTFLGLSIEEWIHVAISALYVVVSWTIGLWLVESLIAILILALLMVWPMLIPVVVYLAMGDRREAVLQSMDTWLDRNTRIITVMVLGAFGLILLGACLSGLFL